MRHLGTVLAAAIVGPLAWILFAVGQDRSEQAFAAAQDGGALDSGDFVRPALVLAAAGLLLGLITTVRFSPLGAALTGLAYSASYLGLLVKPTSVTNLLDHNLTLSGHQVDLAVPLRTGTALVVGVLLLGGVLSIRRWRRWPQPAADTPALQADEVLPSTTQKDRPLGVDGLGLSTPRSTAEPELVRAGGSSGGGGSSGSGSADWAGRSDWAGLLSGGSGARPGPSSDWPRQRSR